MAVIKETDKFVLSSVPQDASPQLRDWLREELQRFALIGNVALELLDELRAAPRMFLGGDAADIAVLSTTPQQILSYTQSGVLGDVPVEPNRLAGTITIPTAAAYRISAFMYGLQPSVTQNQTIRLLLDVDGVQGVIAAFDIASNQTQDRTFTATITRSLPADAVVSMYMDATANVGQFQVQQTSLEVTIVSEEVDSGQVTQFGTDFGWLP